MELSQIFSCDPNEKPLDVIKDDLGFTSIFRKIAVVGDSLASGELEAQDKGGPKIYNDFYDVSWGQFIARMAGTTVYNFSAGGMTAKTYNDGWAAYKGFYDVDKLAQAYIVALGVNDLQNEHQELGTMDDIKDDWHMNAPTFTGYFAKTIQHYKELQPDAVFFLVTFPKEIFPWYDDNMYKIYEDHRELMYKLAEKFDNTYVIDLYQYAPVHDLEYRKTFFTGGHLNTMGYYMHAKMIGSYIDYIVRHNVQKFRQVGFIGTPYKYCGGIEPC